MKLISSWLLVFLVQVSLLATQRQRACGDDWPQWRGPNRDGVYTESGLLRTFPPGGLSVRWRAAVGWGMSSPIVAQGRVYLHDAELTRTKPTERVHCFDALTGKELWTHSYDAAYPDWAYDPTQESGPVATPIFQDGKVYAVGRLGQLLCISADTGNVIWQRNLEQDYQTVLSPGMPSPLIESDLLILVIGGKSGACVVAFKKDTGAEAWRSLNDSLTPSSPIVVSEGGRRQLIVWTQEAVNSLDPADGAILWRQPLTTSGEYAVSTPVFHNDRLLIGGLMLQLDRNQPAASVLWPASKAPARRILSHTSTALLRDEELYSARSSGELLCLDANDGKQLWETDKVTGIISGASIHLTANGDDVLLFNDRGELIRAQMTRQKYTEISRVALIEPTFPFAGRKVAWPPPAFANRHVFVRNGKELICAALSETP